MAKAEFDINLKCTGIKSVPVYESFWQWLFRRPKYWSITVSYEASPE